MSKFIELERDISALAEHRKKRLSGTVEYLISNDTGIPDLLPDIERNRALLPGGIGFVIGSGAIHSLLPSLKLDAVIMADIDPDVLEAAQYITWAITSSGFPWVAMEKIIGKGSKYAERIKQPLQAEVKNLGTVHWSSLRKFNQSREALLDTPIIPLAVDFTKLDLMKKLVGLLAMHGQRFSYMNLTNVHNHVESTHFLTELPIADQPILVQYSALDNENSTTGLKTHIVTSLRQYVERCPGYSYSP